jgi:starvation-inducible DNA-binding protein
MAKMIAKMMAKSGTGSKSGSKADSKADSKRTFKTSIDIKAKTREETIELLNQQLADCFDLYSQSKQAHWNVKGSDFIALHNLFDELAAGLLAFVDEIAERATQLGGYALGSARMSTANSSLPEYPTKATSGQEHVNAMVERYALFAASTRAAIDTASRLNDADTADLFTEISRAIDKSLWFLEAHLQG